MKKIILVIILNILITNLCIAETMKCGKAHVKLELIGKSVYGFEEVILKAINGKKKIQLRFEFVHFGIECRINPKKKKYIVFQAYCSGSACRDLDNYGMIDPERLEVLLVPHDENSKIAEKIFGESMKPVEAF